MNIVKTAAGIWMIIGVVVIAVACAYGVHHRHLRQVEAISAECIGVQEKINSLEEFEKLKGQKVPLSDAMRDYERVLSNVGKAKLSEERDACYGRLVTAQKSFFEIPPLDLI